MNLVLSNKEGNTLRLPKNMVHRNVPGFKWKEITEICRKLHNEELHD
jgi:hypothetical protein